MCLITSGGTQALDPHTGMPRWRLADTRVSTQYEEGRWLSAVVRGRQVVLDSDTGRMPVPLNAWPAVSRSGEGPLLATALRTASGRIMVGVLDLWTGVNRHVATPDGWILLPLCQIGGGILLCRNGSDLRAWRLDAAMAG
jgi:hypothetical protein